MFQLGADFIAYAMHEWYSPRMHENSCCF